MYLGTFRKRGVGPGNWGQLFGEPYEKLSFWNDGPHPDVLLDEIDATLNSWKEAHDVFNRWQQDQPKVDGYAFLGMRHLAHRVIKDRLRNTESSFPCEALTYALLERWIRARQADLTTRTTP